jgi:hypothetical protein
MEWISKIKDVVLGPRVSDEFLKEKRIAPRINCQIEAEITDDKGEQYDGYIIVLEYFGMRCVVPTKFTIGQRLKVTVEQFSGVLGAKDPFDYKTMNVEIVWCRKRRGTPHYYVGVKNIDTPEIIDKSWINFVLASFGITDSPYVQRRKEIRVPSNIPVRCFYSKRSFTCGIIVDMSLGGLKMYFNIDPGEGKDVRLEIGPYRKLPHIECTATVLRSRFINSKNKFEVGVRFYELDNREIRIVSKYILEILKESRG